MLLWLLCAGPADGTTIDNLCSPTADPCVVTGTHLIDSGSLIDAGTRELRVQGRLDVGGGTMTLRAGLVNVPGELRATGSSSQSGGKVIVIAGALRLDGTIDARGAPGGTVALSATQAAQLGGTVTVDNRSGDSSGGTITASADSVMLTGTLSARGGSDASGGDVSITARADLSCDGSIDTSGGDGGDIDLSAATTRMASLTVARTATLRSDATFAGCDGGDIDLDAGGLVTPDATVVVEGQLISTGRSGSEDDGGGSGGALSISATGDIDLAGSEATLSARGASPDGSGGDVTLSAGGAVTVGGPIDVHAEGNDGVGGSLSVDAGGSVELGGDVAASGDSGGAIAVFSAGPMLRVLQDASLDAHAGSSLGGDITLHSDAALSVDGTLRTDGSRDAGGASVELRACSLRIEDDGVVSSLRRQGMNVLIGLDETFIAGRLRADPDTGHNALRFPSLAQRPVLLSGASIEPLAEEIVDATLRSCLAGPTPTLTPIPTRTPTTTLTPTFVFTPTRTATRPPRHTPGQPCVGDCGNDGRVTIDELVKLVGIALAGSDGAVCAPADRDSNNRITVDELVAAVISALTDCV